MVKGFEEDMLSLKGAVPSLMNLEEFYSVKRQIVSVGLIHIGFSDM